MEIPIKIFADGATPELIIKHCDNELVHGFTTNPSLLKASGVKNYAAYAQTLVQYTKHKPISFEVLGDDYETMRRQALIIKSWGDSVYVKIPIMNSHREFQGKLIQELSSLGIKLNITAIFDDSQVKELVPFLTHHQPVIISVFAGRVADVMIDPMPMVQKCHEYIKNIPNCELLWASTRQVFSAIEAARCGCQIITMPFDMIDKLANRGANPLDLSQKAVLDFIKAAKDANLTL